jgi:tetratricopeptide (TPR) repeat protein
MTFGKILLPTLILFIFLSGAFAQEKAAVKPESGKEYNTGIKLYAEGKYAPALEHFTKAAQLDAGNIAAVFAQGLALTKLNRPKDAVERFTVVLAREPNHAKALQALPAALYQSGEVEKALAAYDRSIAGNPKSPSLYTGKAAILIGQKRYGEAVTVLEKARRIAPENMKITETIAYVLAESGKLRDAAILAEKILATHPDNARAHLILGDNLRLTGKSAEALRHYEAASRNLETRAYSEHFIEVIRKQREEEEIEREYERRQQKK